MRAPAKRYLRSLTPLSADLTERACVETLIEAHKHHRMRLEDCRRPAELTWVGRLLWKVFGRWL